jgi:hypothetical protein
MKTPTPRTDEMMRKGIHDEDFNRGIALCRQLEVELNEARAEIERKDRLIEQMREALRAWTKTTDLPLHEAIKKTEAALEAEKRMNNRAR